MRVVSVLPWISWYYRSYCQAVFLSSELWNFRSPKYFMLHRINAKKPKDLSQLKSEKPRFFYVKYYQGARWCDRKPRASFTKIRISASQGWDVKRVGLYQNLQGFHVYQYPLGEEVRCSFSLTKFTQPMNWTFPNQMEFEEVRHRMQRLWHWVTLKLFGKKRFLEMMLYDSGFEDYQCKCNLKIRCFSVGVSVSLVSKPKYFVPKIGLTIFFHWGWSFSNILLCFLDSAFTSAKKFVAEDCPSHFGAESKLSFYNATYFYERYNL